MEYKQPIDIEQTQQTGHNLKFGMHREVMVRLRHSQSKAKSGSSQKINL